MIKRNQFIDLLKFIGIFLVIYGHHPNSMTTYIYSFHMPLFFMLSGTCYIEKQQENFNSFFAHKVKALLVPYLSFSLILFIFWLVIGRHFGEAAINRIPIKEAFVGIFYGVHGFKGISSLEWGGPMWFLLALFIIQIISYFLLKQKKEKIIIAYIFIIYVYFLSKKYIPFPLPWEMQRAVIDLFFYLIGYLYRDKILDINNKNIYKVLVLFLGSLIFFKMKVCLGDGILIHILKYFISGTLGSLFIVEFFKYFWKEKYKLPKYISYIAKNTIIILAFHGRAFTIIKFIIIILFNKRIIENNLGIDFIYSLIQLLLCVPLIYIIHKYFYSMLGNNKNV